MIFFCNRIILAKIPYASFPLTLSETDLNLHKFNNRAIHLNVHIFTYFCAMNAAVFHKNNISRILFLFFVAVLMHISLTPAFSQKAKKVKLLNAARLLGRKINGQEVNILIDSVVLLHDSSYFYCDSAHLIKQTNSFRAFWNVHIEVNDSVDIYSDSLDYDGNTRIAELYGDVRLVDANRAILYTDYLIYNRKSKIARYITWGRIIDEENELISQKGYYYTTNEEFFFKDDVIVSTPDYKMYSDTLIYNTESEIAYIRGPTKIIGEEDSAYCEHGWYDTRKDIAYLKINAFVRHLEQNISGDSLYYDKPNGFGKGQHNVTVADTLQNMMVKGNKARLYENDYYTYMTDSTLAIFIDGLDSLFLHSDTMKVLLDSNKKAETIHAFYKAKFFRQDIQGLCDSLVYKINDSLICMYKEPVLWSEDNQLSADSIKIAISNNAIDTMVLYNNSFIISKDSINSFNQIKGKQMVGYFNKNELYKIIVGGNSETIYFIRDDITGELIGINKGVSSNMRIYLKKQKITNITYIRQPHTPLFPRKDMHPQDLRLRGFEWHGYNRPYKKSDIFYWKTKKAEKFSPSEK